MDFYYSKNTVNLDARKTCYPNHAKINIAYKIKN